MRIAALGFYSLRFGRSRGALWDARVRAFEKFGHENLLIDIRLEKDYKILMDRVLNFKPDILWMDLKDGLQFLIYLVEQTSRRDFLTVWWLGDLRAPENFPSPVPVKHPRVDLGRIQGLIDFFFLTNSGPFLKAYRRIYGINHAYFMPHPLCPEVFHSLDLEKRYELSFAGGMSNIIYHRERTKLIRRLQRELKLFVTTAWGEQLAELYSRSKLVFGANVIDEDPEFQPELYTSSRFQIAMACGACHLCQWFPGIERLVRNHEHVVWWKTEAEIPELLDYYLAHDEERERIAANAEKLAHSHWSYSAIFQDMFDVINGGTEGFRGFLD